MSLTEFFPPFSDLCDYLDSLLKYANSVGKIADASVEFNQKNLDKTLADLDKDIEVYQREILTTDRGEGLGLEEPFNLVTDMESALRMKQAMSLFKSRSVASWLKNTDRDRGDERPAVKAIS